MVENLLAVQVANAPVRLSPHGKIYFLQATLMKSDYMLGIKNPPPGVAPVVSGVLEGAISTNLVWELGGRKLILSPDKVVKAKSIAGAVLLAWMHAEMAQNATEARVKFGKTIYNIFQGACYREYKKEFYSRYVKSKDFWLYQVKNKEIIKYIELLQVIDIKVRQILTFQLPCFKQADEIKQLQEDVNINYNNGAWVWDYQNPILFTRLNDSLKASSDYNDLDFWHYVSKRLPKWCFIWLPYNYKKGKTAMIYSDGEKFINYPRIVWQGKDYFFVWNVKNENKED